MRILHLLDTSAPVISGYSSRSRSIVNAQRDAGHDPVVLTSARFENPEHVLLDEIDGIRYHRSGQDKPTSGIPVSEIVQFRRRIIEVGRVEKPDIIHAHSPILTGIPGWLAARSLGVPCVYEMRSLWEDAAAEKGEVSEQSIRYRLIRNTETFLMKRVDAAVCICEGLKRDLISRGVDPDKLLVVPNGVDVTRFSSMQRDAATESELGLAGKTVVGYIGTFFGFEGVTDLVEAIARLVQQGRNDIAGLIVGKGSTYEDCRQIARNHGMEDRILHPGHVPSERVEDFYSLMDVLAYPRRRYRITELVTPLKPLEAMAMEKAVIGSDVGGIGELIEDGVTGRLHRSGDVEHLAGVIEVLLNDPTERTRLGAQARAWVAEERNWPKLVERYDSAYERIVRQ